GVVRVATLTSTTTSPLLQFDHSSLSVGTATLLGSVLNVGDTGGLTGTAPATVSLMGPLLSATNGSALTVTGRLANLLSGGQVSVTGSADPFVSITGGTHALATNSGAGMFTINAGASLSLSGGLLALSSATVTTSGQLLQSATGVLTTGGPLLAGDGGSLTSSTPNALMTIGANSITSPQQVVRLVNNFSLGLKGALLNAADVVFTTPNNQFSFFAVVDGASVTTTGTSAPLLQFTGTGTPPVGSNNSKVTAARFFLPLAINTPGSAAPTMTLSGPLLN